MKNSKVVKVKITDQYEQDGIEYAIYVNRRRTAPDYRDGLKVVQRRIVDGMNRYERCITTFAKCSAIVGTIMKRTHPHGDSSIYGAMQTVANWFSIKEPLITPQGNFGNFQGDKASAMRYTEAHLSPFAMDCLVNFLQQSKNIVDYSSTYNDQDVEPDYFPAAIPILLVNGTFGIGFGAMSYVPPHNLNEVIDATLKLIDNPDAQITLIPDMCMPCEIIDTNWKSICNKGQGGFKVRGIIDIGEHHGNPALIIKSVPNEVYLNTVTDKIKELINDKKLIQVTNMLDGSWRDKKTGKDVMEYIVVLRKGSDPNYVREIIYSKTEMQKTFTVNFEVLDGINPLRMSYKSYLQAFIEFRKVTHFRNYCALLQDAETRQQELRMYIKVIESGEIDNIIARIRNKTTIDNSEDMEYLINKLKITPLQAKFILGINIQRLSKGYLAKYKEEYDTLQTKVDFCMNKILNEQEIVNDMKEELKFFKKKYGKPRLCKLIHKGDADEIPAGDFKIVITNNNFIKKILPNDSLGNLRGDSVKTVLRVENRENIIIFDKQGKVFKFPVHNIPLTDRNSNGTDIRFISKYFTSDISTVLYEPVLKDLNNKTRKYFITVLTRNGYIKKMDLADFLAVPPSGIIYSKLEDGDYIQDVSIIGDKFDIIVYSKHKALRFNLEQVPHLKRNTKGVSAISQEYVDGLSTIKPNSKYIVVVTDEGNVNKFSIEALPMTDRNKAGCKVIKLSKTDTINSIFAANDNEVIKVISDANAYDLAVSEMEDGSSISAGKRFIQSKKETIIKCNIYKK